MEFLVGRFYNYYNIIHDGTRPLDLLAHMDNKWTTQSTTERIGVCIIYILCSFSHVKSLGRNDF